MSAEDQREAEKFDLDKLKEARLALYNAAVSLPFDIYQTLPDKGESADQYVNDCQKWHDNVAKFYNGAVKMCSANIHPSNCKADLIPASALIGDPPLFDDRLIFTGSSPVYAASFAERVRQDRDVEQQLEAARHFEYETLTPSQQARGFCLYLRKHALDLDAWLRRAIKTFQTAILPQIELGGEKPYNRREARVTMAGETKPPRNVRSKSAQALVSLKKTGRFEFTDRKELVRFNRDFPEIKPHLQKVSGSKKGRPMRSLDGNLRALITIAAKKPQT
ncbi:MAG: hypothetical protein IT461_15180 [Planctomycetes bacterium]|jgi:hypothetical protein|nr:hypothetical protein [Planctomycetota bacterium]